MPENQAIPQSLIKARHAIRNSWWFLPDVDALNARFLAFRNANIRVTIWRSDGQVVYDNFNGTTTATIQSNYGLNPGVGYPPANQTVVTTNHGTRLEGQLALTHPEGGVDFRASLSVSGGTPQKFLYWACWVNKRLAGDAYKTYRVARLALLLNPST